MRTAEVLLLVAVAFAGGVAAYPAIATKHNWPRGQIFENGVSALVYLGTMALGLSIAYRGAISWTMMLWFVGASFFGPPIIPSLFSRYSGIRQVNPLKEDKQRESPFMKKILHGLLTALGAVFLTNPVSAAEVTCTTGGIRLIGSITKGDFKKVSSCWETINQTTWSADDFTDEPPRDAPSAGSKKIELNKKTSSENEVVDKLSIFAISSQGGLVSEAMKIGKYVRSKRMWVVIPDHGECFSSCIYVLAAGVVRHPWGDIGIHRPYLLTAPNQSYDAVLKSMLAQSKDYFMEMNVPDFLAEDMFSIPPSEIKKLGDSSLTKYRLNQPDMAYEEENALRNAKHYGMSRQEYMARLKQQEQYNNECLASIRGKGAVKNSVQQCSDISYKKAGLVSKD